MKAYQVVNVVCARCNKTVEIPSIARGRFKYCKDCRREIDRTRHRNPMPPSKVRDCEERRTARARDGIGGEYHITKDPDESWGCSSSFTLTDIEEMLENDYLTPGTEFAKEPSRNSTHRVVKCGDLCKLDLICVPHPIHGEPMTYSCLNQKHQEELIAIRDGMNILQWRVGDIANEEYAAQKNTYSFNYICAAVGYYVGKSGSTIQRWARVSAFYGPEWRTRYDGLLSFEHYVAAMGCPNWQELLEKAATGGALETPQSVDRMLAESSFSRPPFTPPQPDNFPVPPAAVVSYEMDVPQVQIVGCPENAFQAILSMIGKLADTLGLDEGRRAKVYRAIELLNEALGVSLESR